MEQEQQQQNSLFNLNFDQAIRAHLSEAAKWGKFLAIFGFIICGLIVVVGLFMAANFNELTSTSRRYSMYDDGAAFQGMGTMMAVIYIILAAIYFFPCLFLLRFSNKMKVALQTDDQAMLTGSFQNLKVMFRFVGILTIIIIAFYLLAFIAGGIASM
jgi:uncharacterized membrane protein YjgN (DUF898 family)